MAAGTRRLNAAIPAGGVVENILAGSPLEYPGVPSRVEIAATVPSGVPPDVTVDIIFGTDYVAEGLVVPAERAIGDGPVLPDNVLLVDALAAVDHLQVRARNANAAAQTITAAIRVTPV